jgi:hypothetical protein
VYRNVIRAIIESSLVSWIGLLTYGITTIGSKPTRPSDDVSLSRRHGLRDSDVVYRYGAARQQRC